MNCNKRNWNCYKFLKQAELSFVISKIQAINLLIPKISNVTMSTSEPKFRAGTLLWLCSAHRPRWCTPPEMLLSSEVNSPVPKPPSMFRVLARASHELASWNLRTICKVQESCCMKCRAAKCRCFAHVDAFSRNLAARQSPTSTLHHHAGFPHYEFRCQATCNGTRKMSLASAGVSWMLNVGMISDEKASTVYLCIHTKIPRYRLRQVNCVIDNSGVPETIGWRLKPSRWRSLKYLLPVVLLCWQCIAWGPVGWHRAIIPLQGV